MIKKSQPLAATVITLGCLFCSKIDQHLLQKSRKPDFKCIKTECLTLMQKNVGEIDAWGDFFICVNLTILLRRGQGFLK